MSVRRPLVLVAVLFGLVLSVSGASAGSENILQRLNGTWEGPGMILKIDASRLQAQLDPNKPFSWQPLQIDNVAGEMVVFRIGEQAFIGLFGEDQLTVTSPQFSGSFALKRLAF